jgi:hypothetical protein
MTYSLRGKCHAPNCTPPLWAVCKVMPSCMQLPKNYVCCQYYSLLMLQAARRTPQINFLHVTTKIAK